MYSPFDQPNQPQVVQAICEADPTVVGDRIEVDEIIDDQEYRLRYVGKLPLHLLIACNSFDSGGVSENADCFRYLLKRFPMAALLVDRWETHKHHTLYQPILSSHPSYHHTLSSKRSNYHINNITKPYLLTHSPTRSFNSPTSHPPSLHPVWA